MLTGLIHSFFIKNVNSNTAVHDSISIGPAVRGWEVLCSGKKKKKKVRLYYKHKQ